MPTSRTRRPVWIGALAALALGGWAQGSQAAPREDFVLGQSARSGAVCTAVRDWDDPLATRAGQRAWQVMCRGWTQTLGRIYAFHTDSDLASAESLTPDALVERARKSPTLGLEIADSGAPPPGPARICAAHGSRLAPPGGEGWLAVGDSALAFDPLSSQGLFNALYTGLTGGRAMAARLAGDKAAVPGYASRLNEIWAAYEHHRRLYYGQERRWPEAPFWARRR